MDKVVLTSERTLSDCSNFAVGIFQDDELHITPLKSMLHMKLQCDYLDENDKHTRDGTKNTGEGKRGFFLVDLYMNIFTEIACVKPSELGTSERETLTNSFAKMQTTTRRKIMPLR